jgi:anti-anti-sigma factor
MSDVIQNNGEIRIRPGGDIVASMARDFKKELLSLLDSKPTDLIIDLEGVEMIDSVGLGVLIATYNSIRETGGKLVLINSTAEICKLFKSMRLDKHFTVIC